jgi:hypothetical protein
MRVSRLHLARLAAAHEARTAIGLRLSQVIGVGNLTGLHVLGRWPEPSRPVCRRARPPSDATFALTYRPKTTNLILWATFFEKIFPTTIVYCDFQY